MGFCMVPAGGLLGRSGGGLLGLGPPPPRLGFCMGFCMVPRMVPRWVLQGGRAGPLLGLAGAGGGLGASPPFRFRLWGGSQLPQPPRPPHCRDLGLGGRPLTSLIPYNAGFPAGWAFPKPAFPLGGRLLNSLIPYNAGFPALPAAPQLPDSPAPRGPVSVPRPRALGRKHGGRARKREREGGARGRGASPLGLALPPSPSTSRPAAGIKAV